MGDITIEDVTPFEPNAKVHHIPFKIQYTGPAKVSTFFIPTETDKEFEGKKVLQSSFRGRRLKGVEFEVPPGYSGVVFKEDVDMIVHNGGNEEQEVENDTNDTGAQSGHDRVWTTQSTFSSLTFWSHDSDPRRQDPPIRWMEWLQIAPYIHKPITEEMLKAPVRCTNSKSNE